MSNFIFNTRPDNVAPKFYCLKGQEDFLDDDGMPRLNNDEPEKVAAKCIQNKRPKHFRYKNANYKYYIRMTPNNDIFNPIEILSPIKEKRNFNFIDSTCKQPWAFAEVNENIFNKYVQFLTTHNIALLKEVNRELK